jgi:hypothetical protein
MEPVGIVRRALFDGPIPHGSGDDFGHLQGQLLLAGLDREQLLEDTLRQSFTHDGVGEAVDSVTARDRRFSEIDVFVHIRLLAI